jgi:hypothetical protein
MARLPQGTASCLAQYCYCSKRLRATSSPQDAAQRAVADCIRPDQCDVGSSVGVLNTVRHSPALAAVRSFSRHSRSNSTLQLQSYYCIVNTAFHTLLQHAAGLPLVYDSYTQPKVPACCMRVCCIAQHYRPKHLTGGFELLFVVARLQHVNKTCL